MATVASVQARRSCVSQLNMRSLALSSGYISQRELWVVGGVFTVCATFRCGAGDWRSIYGGESSVVSEAQPNWCGTLV